MVIIVINTLDHAKANNFNQHPVYIEFIGRYHEIDANYLYLHSAIYNDGNQDGDGMIINLDQGTWQKAIYQLAQDKKCFAYCEHDDTPESIQKITEKIRKYFKKYKIRLLWSKPPNKTKENH